MKPSIPNPQAFPLMGRAPEDQAPVEHHGMTLREYFAAHAPGCPDWYWPEFAVPRPKPPDPEDYIHADVNPCAKEDRKEIQGWLSYGCYDLPEHLQAFQRAHADHRNRVAAWDLMRNKNRVVAWRWEYAELMLAQGAKAATDAEALDDIAELLSGQEWGPDELDAIAGVVRKTGRKIKEPR